MADKNLVSYSKKLAIKLRDPVPEGNTDGKVFFNEFRYNYLSRGLGRLVRDLMLIGFEINKLWPNYYATVSQYVTSEGFSLTAPESQVEKLLNNNTLLLSTLSSTPVFNIHQAIAKKKSGDPLKGSYMDILQAFNGIFGIQNSTLDLTQLTDRFYYTIDDGNLRLLAKDDVKIVSLHFLIEKDTPDFTPEGSEDLFVPRKYEDLYLTACALEASIDIGNIQKVNLYRSEFNTELKILSTGIQLKKQQETTDSK